MRPIIEKLRRSKTAIASSPESATSRRRPSGVTETETGQAPRPCGRPTDSVFSTSSFFRSITATVSWLASATKARLPFGSIAIPLGVREVRPDGDVLDLRRVRQVDHRDGSGRLVRDQARLAVGRDRGAVRIAAG